MGTGHQHRALVKLGLLTTYAGMFRGGRNGHSRILDLMSVSRFAKRYPDNARTGSWMSRNPQVLIDALQDSKRNYHFSRGAYEALFRTIEEDIDIRRAARMPKDLPILILSGDEDPVGEKGKGVKRFAHMLEKIGMTDVVCQIYPGARHELLCDLNKEQVTQDIKTWCSKIQHREKSRNAGG